MSYVTTDKLNSIYQDGVRPNSNTYVTCSTAAGTAAKAVAYTGFKLTTGKHISVKFTVTNTAANPTLNVNSTGAKAIYYRGAAIAAGYLAANRTYEFVYNGSQWELIGDINTDTNNAVTQTNTTGSADYRLLFSNTADDTTRTEGARKNTGLKYNPSTHIITVGNGTSDTTSDIKTSDGISLRSLNSSLSATYNNKFTNPKTNGTIMLNGENGTNYGYDKAGNIVTLFFNIYALTNAVANTAMIEMCTNLPKPKHGIATIIMASGGSSQGYSPTDGAISVNIRTDGILRAFKTTTPTASYYYGYITYICE